MQFVINQNHRPAAFACVQSIAQLADCRFVGQPTHGFLHLCAPSAQENTLRAVRELLTEAALPFIERPRFLVPAS